MLTDQENHDEIIMIICMRLQKTILNSTEKKSHKKE